MRNRSVVTLSPRNCDGTYLWCGKIVDDGRIGFLLSFVKKIRIAHRHNSLVRITVHDGPVKVPYEYCLHCWEITCRFRPHVIVHAFAVRFFYLLPSSAKYLGSAIDRYHSVELCADITDLPLYELTFIGYLL